MNRNRVFALSAAGLASLAGLYLWQAPAIKLAWSEYLLTVQTMQRVLHQSLSGALRSIQIEGVGASSTLVALSFFYGVLHAAG